MDRHSLSIKKKCSIFLILIFFLFAGCIETKKDEVGANNGSPFNSRDNLFDVEFISAEEGWVVGTWGGIYQTKDQGKTWIKQNSGTQLSLTDVSFVDALNGWCVGFDGIILKTQDGGKNWNKLMGPTEYKLSKVQFVDINNGWAVGAWGTIIHTSDGGNTWENQSLEEDSNLHGLSFIDKEQGWVVGEFGTIMHTVDGGKSWVKQDGFVDDKTFFGVSFKDPYFGVVVGIDGIIFSTEDGGNKWYERASPTKLSLMDVSICGDWIWAVGIRGEIVKGKLDDSSNNFQLDTFEPDDKTYRYLSGIDCFENLICTVGNHATIRQYSN